MVIQVCQNPHAALPVALARLRERPVLASFAFGHEQGMKIYKAIDHRTVFHKSAEKRDGLSSEFFHDMQELIVDVGLTAAKHILNLFEVVKSVFNLELLLLSVLF